MSNGKQVELALSPRIRILTRCLFPGRSWSLMSYERFRVRYVVDGAVQCQQAIGPEYTTGDYTAYVETPGDTIEILFADGLPMRVTVHTGQEGGQG